LGSLSLAFQAIVVVAVVTADDDPVVP